MNYSYISSIKKLIYMKTKIIMGFLAISIVISSCKKDISDQQIEKNISDNELVKRVEKFIELANNAKEGKILKSGEKIPIEDALAYIDETFNYEYCHHSTNFRSIKNVSIFIDIPIISIEEKIYLVDAVMAYNDAVTAIRNKYNQLTDGVTKLLNVQVKEIGIDPTEQYITVEIIGIVGIGIAPVVSTSEMEYFWNRGSSSCDYQLSNIGAPEVMGDAINFVMNISPGPHYRVIWTNNDDETFNYSDYSNSGVFDNFCDFKIYSADIAYGPLDPITCCLGEQNGINEMQYYMNYAQTIINQFLDPINMDFQSIFIQSDQSEDLSNIYHTYVVHYGHKHLILNPDIAYPINITIE